MPTLYFSISKEALMPCEELLEIENSRRQLLIGVPRESDPCESRIALTPETVGVLVQHGHRVLVEKQAGGDANYTDLQYSEAGAFIVEQSEAYRADILFKINPPATSEVELMKDRQLLFSYLPGYQLSEEYVRKLAGKHITAIAFENIKDRFGCYPLVKAMSEIAGNVSVQTASEYLSKSSGGKGILLGGISGVSPAEVVIIGSGTAAEFAARSALGSGAFVRVFDNSVHHLQRLQGNLGVRLYTSVMHPQVLAKALASADALIGTACVDEYQRRRLITEEMIACMKPGSVIVDLSINRGGCCETSEIRTLASPVVVKHGVIHYCVPNITSRVPRTASMAISNVLVDMILSIGQQGSLTGWLKSDADLRNGVYMYNGILTSAYIGNLFGIPFQDIHLLMAAF
ncbi:MAG: alanine dehydrogenase [Bacteroidales bacterium]|jgi:alanine dehydrogenase|nr:alanine dehydrogenase [Bacteroidales bacterium]